MWASLIPWGVSLISSLFGGGGSSQPAQQAAPAASTQGGGMLGQLQVQDAIRQGFQQGFYGAEGQPPAYAGTVPRRKQPGQAVDQEANQRGGQGFSPTGGSLNALPGPGYGGGGTTATATTKTTPDPNAPANLYTNWLQQALMGQGGLNPAAYRSQFTSGLGTINTQAAQGASNLSNQLGARGLLQSGVMGAGLQGIEGARMKAIGDFINNLQQRQAQSQLDTQNKAAGLFAGERAQNLQAALQAGLLEKENALNQPSWADYLGQALGIYAGTPAGSNWLFGKNSWLG